MENVVIVSACRTAIGDFGGTLRDVNITELGRIVMTEAVTRAGIEMGLVDDVRMGCNLEPADAMNVARVSALLAGIPASTTAVTINRVCISGMEAVLSGMAMIQAGMSEVVLAGGVEHMSSVPYTIPAARWGARLQDNLLQDALIHGLHCGSYFMPLGDDAPVDVTRAPASHILGKPYIMGHTAELVAQKYGISREEMDEVSLRSHNNAERATNQGEFKEEIVPVAVPQRKKDPLIFDRDEHFRPGMKMADLSRLKPAFVPGAGKITAGNASGINDGASAMIIMTEGRARALGLTPLARIKAMGKGGCHPAIMGVSPKPAVDDLQRKSGLKVSDFELVELNEAFAAQYIGCEREIGLNREITNVNGSGIGLGHPVGSTGCRIMVTLIHAMKNRGKTLGLATLCGGGGVSMACALEML